MSCTFRMVELWGSQTKKKTKPPALSTQSRISCVALFAVIFWIGCCDLAHSILSLQSHRLCWSLEGFAVAEEAELNLTSSYILAVEIASLPCGGREWVSSFIFVFIYLLFLRQIWDWNYSREQRSSLLSLMSHSSSLFLFIYLPPQPVSIKIKPSIISGQRRNFKFSKQDEQRGDACTCRIITWRLLCVLFTVLSGNVSVARLCRKYEHVACFTRCRTSWISRYTPWPVRAPE